MNQVNGKSILTQYLGMIVETRYIHVGMGSCLNWGVWSLAERWNHVKYLKLLVAIVGYLSEGYKFHEWTKKGSWRNYFHESTLVSSLQFAINITIEFPLILVKPISWKSPKPTISVKSVALEKGALWDIAVKAITKAKQKVQVHLQMNKQNSHVLCKPHGRDLFPSDVWSGNLARAMMSGEGSHHSHQYSYCCSNGGHFNREESPTASSWMGPSDGIADVLKGKLIHFYVQFGSS